MGPSSFAEWARSWRVFCFAIEMLGAATRTRLKRYHDTIATFNTDYPMGWWAIAVADFKIREAPLREDQAAKGGRTRRDHRGWARVALRSFEALGLSLPRVGTGAQKLTPMP